MRKYLFFILLFNTQLMAAQSKNDTLTTEQVEKDIDYELERGEKISFFANSINSYDGGDLPAFLFDTCFDTQTDLWQGLPGPVSLRWMVLEQVYNKEALGLILASQDKRLKAKCKYDKRANDGVVIPMISKTYYQLIQKRYKQM